MMRLSELKAAEIAGLDLYVIKDSRHATYKSETAEGCNPRAASESIREEQMEQANCNPKSQGSNGKKAKVLTLCTALGPNDPDDGDTGRRQTAMP